ncbi:23S rRNA (uracil(1939)-C(5))-methyltransferase RlmD [Vibrio sp. SCSIO 43140]|uniref:23S rRNA (uracil(1939)-C(5))-methyltransferase RlmD n=1 Tax=Vibrio sp. SCSIO 43140 TaxID=2819100 RepID=UPI0020751B6C|nr:23S rRNA (uracil(1939)-C(5))-methyltransferase RlmD [Vibrio sp. SCSIO 43140]USD60080.1 23S rRNA (uracil(1939)-C(5))-methyltransferase RlmD [Vibrio sp. SCSIO 43140]
MARFFKPTKKTSFSKKHQEVQIERMDHHGAGIGYINKKPVFVERALANEKVLVQLTESKAKFAKANLIKVLTPSEQRVEPFCPHYYECGGCNQQHLEREEQITHKERVLSQLMTKFAGQTLALSPSITGEGLGYRRRARLSIHVDKQRGLMMGFRRKQSNQIVDVDHCPVLDNKLNALIPELRKIFDGFRQPSILGHLELVLGEAGPIAVIRHTKALSEKEQTRLIEYAEQMGITLYLMPEANQLDRVVGEQPYYAEVGVKLPFLPSHFIQVNQAINARMVTQALEWLAPVETDRVLDLFCGLGNFTLPLASRSAHVVGVEGVQDMVDWAADNAKLNGISNVEFYQANLEQDLSSMPWASQQFDKILLDPARAGASGVIDQVSALGATRVLYVSCNPATLARDSQSLLEQGYTLTRLGMMDMFPHTSHLESMALFEK